MKDYILIGIIVVIVIIAGYFVYHSFIPASPAKPTEIQSPNQNQSQNNSQNTAPVRQTPITDYQFSCNSDDECVLKSDPFCCAGDIEYIDNCYHVDQEPRVIEKGKCDPLGPCPSQEIPNGCRCKNSKCVNVYKEKIVKPGIDDRREVTFSTGCNDYVDLWTDLPEDRKIEECETMLNQQTADLGNIGFEPINCEVTQAESKHCSGLGTQLVCIYICKK